MTISSAVSSYWSQVPSFWQLRERANFALSNNLPGNSKLRLRLNDPQTGDRPTDLTQIMFGARFNFTQGSKVERGMWRVLKEKRSSELFFLKGLHERYLRHPKFSAVHLPVGKFRDVEGTLMAAALVSVQEILPEEWMNYLITVNDKVDGKVDNGEYPMINGLTYMDLMNAEAHFKSKDLRADGSATRFLSAASEKAVDITIELQRNCELIMEKFNSMDGTARFRGKLKMENIMLGTDDNLHAYGHKPLLSMIADGDTLNNTVDSPLVVAVATKMWHDIVAPQ